MIQKKAALVEIVTNHGYVAFRSVNEHLKGKNRMLQIRDMNALHDRRRGGKKYIWWSLSHFGIKPY